MNLEEHIKIMQLNGTYHGELYDQQGGEITLVHVPTETDGDFFVQPFVDNIGHQAFCGCHKITNIRVLGDIKTVSSRAFTILNLVRTLQFDGNVEKMEQYVCTESHLREFVVRGKIEVLRTQFYPPDMESDSLDLRSTLYLLKIGDVGIADAIEYENIKNIQFKIFGKNMKKFVKHISYDDIHWI